MTHGLPLMAKCIISPHTYPFILVEKRNSCVWLAGTELSCLVSELLTPFIHLLQLILNSTDTRLGKCRVYARRMYGRLPRSRTFICCIAMPIPLESIIPDICDANTLERLGCRTKHCIHIKTLWIWHILIQIWHLPMFKHRADQVKKLGAKVSAL